jgi:hypothetical protein
MEGAFKRSLLGTSPCRALPVARGAGLCRAARPCAGAGLFRPALRGCGPSRPPHPGDVTAASRRVSVAKRSARRARGARRLALAGAPQRAYLAARQPCPSERGTLLLFRPFSLLALFASPPRLTPPHPLPPLPPPPSQQRRHLGGHEDGRSLEAQVRRRVRRLRV